MSSSFYDLGDFEKAEELGLEAVDIYTKTLGPEHDKTIMARENLGKIQIDARQVQKALGKRRQ